MKNGLSYIPAIAAFLFILILFGPSKNLLPGIESADAYYVPPVKQNCEHNNDCIQIVEQNHLGKITMKNIYLDCDNSNEDYYEDMSIKIKCMQTENTGKVKSITVTNEESAADVPSKDEPVSTNATIKQSEDGQNDSSNDILCESTSRCIQISQEGEEGEDNSLGDITLE